MFYRRKIGNHIFNTKIIIFITFFFSVFSIYNEFFQNKFVTKSGNACLTELCNCLVDYWMRFGELFFTIFFKINILKLKLRPVLFFFYLIKGWAESFRLKTSILSSILDGDCLLKIPVIININFFFSKRISSCFTLKKGISFFFKHKKRTDRFQRKYFYFLKEKCVVIYSRNLPLIRKTTYCFFFFKFYEKIIQHNYSSDREFLQLWI